MVLWLGLPVPVRRGDILSSVQLFKQLRMSQSVAGTSCPQSNSSSSYASPSPALQAAPRSGDEFQNACSNLSRVQPLAPGFGNALRVPESVVPCPQFFHECLDVAGRMILIREAP